MQNANLNARLMDALNFTPADLAANRNGNLSQQQRELIEKIIQTRGCFGVFYWGMFFYVLAFILIFGCAGAVGFAALAWLNGTRSAFSLLAGFATAPAAFLGLMAFAVLGVIFIASRQTNRLRETAALGRIQRVHGPVYIRRSWFETNDHVGIILSCGGTELTTYDLRSRWTWKRAFVEGETYTIYYLPDFALILSAEWRP
jgi:uncharacterized integral membrane protein